MPETMTSPEPGSNEEYFQRCSRADWLWQEGDPATEGRRQRARQAGHL